MSVVIHGGESYVSPQRIKQIPPIDKNQDNHVLDNPHVFLDEIMRQALDSEIIRASMWIRERKPIYSFPCEQKEVMVVEEPTDGMLLWANQVLCATNRVRIETNERIRKLLGFEGPPQIGDKIIGLHNQWNFLSENEEALTNGCIGYITNFYLDNLILPPSVSKEPVPVMYTDFETENGDMFLEVPIDYTFITTGKKFLTPEQEYRLRKMGEEFPDPPFDFTYGYAITTHKAQGSSWGKILVLEEWFPRDAEEHARWLYTAITRAAQRCVIIKK